MEKITTNIPESAQLIFGVRIASALAAAAALGFLLLSGCAVGPDYHRPAALGSNAMPRGFGDPSITNAAEWKAADPSAHLPRGAWWEVYGDAELNRLETLAASNQQIAISLATFEQARAPVKVPR